MRMPKIRRGGGILSVKIFAALIAVVAMVGVVVPMVHADEPIDVMPGADTLQKAINDASDGAILKLSAGSYTGDEYRTLEINKSVTIEGVGNYYDDFKSTIDVPIKITASGKSVTLKNVTSNNQQVPYDFISMQIDASDVKLNMDKVTIMGIGRSSDKGNATMLDLTANATHSIINITNSEFTKPHYRYGLVVKSSQNEITFDGNSYISAVTPVLFESGSDNQLKISGGSKIVGPATPYKDDRTIAIDKQNNLTINISGGSTVLGSVGSGKPVRVFAFGSGDNKSTNVKINLENGGLAGYRIEEDIAPENNTIFALSSDNTPADNNIINIDAESKLYTSLVNRNHTELSRDYNVPFERKYSTPFADGSAMIGITDKDGNLEAKLYNKSEDLTSTLESKAGEKEGYKFKNWYKQADFAADSIIADDDKTVSGVNHDFYPKYNKIVKLTIKDVPQHEAENKDVDYENLEEGTIASNTDYVEEIRQDLNSIIESERSVALQGFTISIPASATSEYFTKEDIENLINNFVISDDAIIEPIIKVQVSVQGEDFEDLVDPNTTYAEFYATHGEIIDAIKNKSPENKTGGFWKFVEESSGLDITDDYQFTTNVTLVPKYMVKIGIKQQGGMVEDFTLGDGQILNENSIISDELDQLQDIFGKRFGRFENTDTKELIKRDETPITEDITIEPVYVINVKIGENEKLYELDEGQSLSGSREESEAIKEALDNLASSVPDGHHLDGFIVHASFDNDVPATKHTFDVNFEGSNKGEIINQIMNQELYSDATIIAEFKIKVSIEPYDGGDKVELEDLETGTILQSILDDSENQYHQKLYDAIYGTDGSREERFYAFKILDGDSEKEGYFNLGDEVTGEITLRPKYWVKVVMDNVEGHVVKGTKYNEFINDSNGSIAKKLEEMQSSTASHDDPGEDAETLHFEKLRIDKGEDKEDLPESGIIEEDVKLISVYHYDFDIITNYDNPSENPAKFTVLENEAISSDTEKARQARTALETLQKSATNSDQTRKFYKFVDTMGEKDEFDNIDSLLEKIHNNHLNITAKVQYKVSVTDQSGESKDFYVVEGENIASNPDLVEAIQQLGQEDGWKATEYVVDKQQAKDLASIQSIVINQPAEISANYQIRVKIEGDPSDGYWLDQNTEPNDSQQKNAIETALANLKSKVETTEGLTFKGYMVNGKTMSEFSDVMQSNFNEPTEITAIRELTIAIGEQAFTLEDDDSLNALKEISGYEEATTKANRKLLWLKDNDTGYLIDPNNTTYSFTKNTTLIPIYGIDVKVEGLDATYRLEEGQTLENILKESEKQLAKSDKKLVGFTADEIGEVTSGWNLDDSYSKDTLTLKPKYAITVTIVDYQGNTIDEIQLDEGQNLADVEGWNTKINERAVNKTYDGLYDQDSKKLDPKNIKPNANTQYTAKYTVKITLKDSQGGQEDFTIPEGGKLAYLEGEEKTKLEKWTNNDKYVQSDLNLENPYTENSEVSVRMYKTVTIGEVPHKVIEGTTLQALIDSEELSSDAPEGQHFVKFIQAGGGEKYELDRQINEDLTLKPIYGLYITVQTYDQTASISSVTKNTSNEIKETPYEFVLENELESGVNMDSINRRQDIQDSLNKGHIRFDYVDGQKIPDGTVFTKDTTIRDVYPIKIMTTDKPEGYELESWQTLNDLKELESLKTSADGREFSHFADSNNNKIDVDEPLFENLFITPKFYITITVTPYIGEEVVEGIESKSFKFGEDQLLSELVKTKEWQDWANNVTDNLASNGKPNYYFSHYLNEDGSAINIDDERYSEDTNLRAVFVYSSVAPSTPDIPSTSPTTDNTQNVTPKAPNTGVGTNDTTAFTIVGAITAIIAASALAFEFVQRGRLRK